MTFTIPSAVLPRLTPGKRNRGSLTTFQSAYVQKGLQECLYINHCGISWPVVSYSITFFSQDDFKDTEKDPDAPESEDEGETQVEYSSD